MARTPDPIVLAFLICDYVDHDPKANAFSTGPILWRIYTRKFPMPLNRLAAYGAITGLRQPASVVARLVRSSAEEFEAEEIRASRPLTATPRGPAEDIDFALDLGPVVFPEPGEYEMLLEVAGRVIARRKLEIRKKEVKAR